ncbi:PQQ-binding-like beta-propeller repeat protein [Snuella lapsa]|uniref:Pyrrolo-quinoline quinone repeat domain-containing protein n=1 Tax=Snuella lapsa TaxID=870481 RepID=A0ABP6XA33_9FLAO
MFLLLVACGNTYSYDETEYDWVSYQHDNQNSGISPVALHFPLTMNWQIVNEAPQAAWPAPAKQDYYNKVRKLEALVTYDRAYHTTAANGLIYFSSSATHQVYCHDINTGERKWSFFTNGPNRTAPTINKGRLFFSSDDGFVYCLDAYSGTLIWKYKPGKSHLKVIGNGKVVGASPCRTGVLIKGDTLYATEGLLPEQDVYVSAINASTGHIIWERKQEGLAPQGYPVMSDDEIFIPNSRTQPFVLKQDNGELVKKLKGKGGDYLSLAKDKIVHGVDHNSEIKSDDFLSAAFKGHKVIIDKEQYFVAADFQLTSIVDSVYNDITKKRKALSLKINELTALIREKKLAKKEVSTELTNLTNAKSQLDSLINKEFNWQTPINKPISMVKSQNAIIIGEVGKVSAYNVINGALIWTEQIDGHPYGMSIANESLFVSTDKGTIYCFSSDKISKKKKIRQEVNTSYYAENSKREMFERAADVILERTNRRAGFCLITNFNEGRLAYELALKSNFQIIGVESDPDKVKKARKALDACGLYGKRITLFEGDLEDLEFTKYFANLVTDDRLVEKGTIVVNEATLFEVLQPNGGKVILTNNHFKEAEYHDLINKERFIDCKWTYDDESLVVTRPRLPNSGEWTHLYGNPANTVSSGDKKVNEKITPQWFGQPGPREMTDRHHRAVSPLYKNGILFIPKDNGVIASDAYNGTLLWNKDIANFRRIKISRDAGSLAVGNSYFYAVADNTCNVFEPLTGEEMAPFKVPQLFNVDRDWGYLAVVDDQLFGSARKTKATYNEYSRFDWGEYSNLVCSDYLFSMNSENGKLHWTYKDGMVLNPTITIGEEKMFFVESRSLVAMQDEDGLIDFNTFKKEKPFIVALDTKTGKKLWEKAFDFNLLDHVLYGSYDKGLLVLSGSGNKDGGLWYGTYVFKAESGDLVWKQEQKHADWVNGSHGEQLHRALIMEDKIYVEPFAYNLFTGEQVKDWKLNRKGHSCGNISGSSGQLFFRGSNPSLVDVSSTDQASRINSTTRTGCWINIIPAGGLVMIPEASSGCSCNYPLQMSVTYLPL